MAARWYYSGATVHVPEADNCLKIFYEAILIVSLMPGQKPVVRPTDQV